MLQFGAKTFTIDGVTVFADHADPLQFWYLPATVAFARRPEDDRADFQLITYRPAALAAGAKGGGFAMFSVDLRLSPQTEGRIRSRVASLARGGEARLAAVPFDEGTVRCIALNLEGAGGTSAQTPPPGAFNAVEHILGATKPSFGANNTAAFNLVLSQEGAIILEQALKQGVAPLGVVYDLKYTGLSPALSVEITADYNRIYTHFSAGLEAQIYWFRIGIDAGFEKLVQDKAIEVKVINFSNAADREQQEKAALDFFKEHLIGDLFTPSLNIGQMAGGAAQPEGLDAVLKRAKELLPDATKRDDEKPEPGENKAPKAQDKPPTALRQPAAFAIIARDPDPTPTGYSIEHTPAASGTQETLRVIGPEGMKVLIDGKPVEVTMDFTPRPGGEPELTSHDVSVDVAPESEHKVEVSWPATRKEGTEAQVFRLFFSYDFPQEPVPASAWGLQHPVRAAYVANSPPPQGTPPKAEARFKEASGVEGQTFAGQGADALKEWLGRLASPKIVHMTGHASYEGHDDTTTISHNQRLSVRRLDVAQDITRPLASIGSATPRGQSVAASAVPPRRGDENDRVVLIAGKVNTSAPDKPAVTLTGVIKRAADQQEKDDQDADKKDDDKKDEDKKTGGDGGKGGGGSISSSTPALVSLKLKFLRQEERKTAKFVYNRTEAIQRPYAPQGFVGPLLKDLTNAERHFVQVDLDHVFFREFQVTVDAPTPFEPLGLESIQVSIDYGDPGDAATVRHKDFIFDRTNEGARQTFTTFLSPKLATAYSHSVQFHFRGDSGWFGEKLSYEKPAVRTADRTLVVSPFDLLGFLEVSVFPNRIDTEEVDFTEVELSYTSPAFSKQTTLIVRPDSAPQKWRLRLSNPEITQYSFRFVHHLKDGTIVTTDPTSSGAAAVPVDDPFTARLDIELIPLWDPATMRTVFVDVTHQGRARRVQFEGAERAPRKLHIALRDPTQREFSFQATFVGIDNRIVRRAAETTTDTIVGLSE